MKSYGFGKALLPTDTPESVRGILQPAPPAMYGPSPIQSGPFCLSSGNLILFTKAEEEAQPCQVARKVVVTDAVIDAVRPVLPVKMWGKDYHRQPSFM